MATHSSVLAWRIPGMAEPGGLPSMGSHRVMRRKVVMPFVTMWMDLEGIMQSEKGQRITNTV